MVCDNAAENLFNKAISLNPCFNGIWSAIKATLVRDGEILGLNPCFNGIWSATAPLLTLSI